MLRRIFRDFKYTKFVRENPSDFKYTRFLKSASVDLRAEQEAVMPFWGGSLESGRGYSLKRTDDEEECLSLLRSATMFRYCSDDSLRKLVKVNRLS